MSGELALLPPRTQMWPELENSSDVCGFRGIDAVEMAAAMWPRNPNGAAPKELRVRGRGHEAGCDCAGCKHGPPGSNVDRTIVVSGSEMFGGDIVRQRGASCPAPDDAAGEREFWARVRADGHRAAARWWRSRGVDQPLPLDFGPADDDGFSMELPLRRSSALVIAPGVLTVKWSSAPTGPTDEDLLEHAEDCPCDECEAFRALFDADRDGEDQAVDDRVISGFSARSKGRMMRYVASVDWASVKEPNERLVGITLTYPGGDWRRWAPTPASVLAHLTAFCKRFERATGRPMRCVWVREFQRRGAPHYHLCALAPTHIKGKPFRVWQSRAWYEVVGSGEASHLRAGTRIDFKTSLGMAIDPKRAAAYFGGYTSKDKAYQHEAPEGWTNENGSVGAYWGRRGVTLATSEVPVTAANVVEIKRIMRRMVRAQKRTVTVLVGRNYETITTLGPDELVIDNTLADGTMLTPYGQSQTFTRRIPTRTRRVTRRWRLKSLTPQGPAADGQRGFSVFANDAPLLAAQLARVIHPNQPPWPKGQRRPLP